MLGAAALVAADQCSCDEGSNAALAPHRSLRLHWNGSAHLLGRRRRRLLLLLFALCKLQRRALLSAGQRLLLRPPKEGPDARNYLPPPVPRRSLSLFIKVVGGGAGRATCTWPLPDSNN